MLYRHKSIFGFVLMFGVIKFKHTSAAEAFYTLL